MFLGIDLGTSEVKVVLLDEAQQVLGSAGAALNVARPQPGHSEQNPQDWWQATQAALSELRQAQPKAWASVRAIGLSGQMHGAVLLNAQNQVLRPAILWNDVRSAEQCQQMMDECPELAQLGGSLAMPGFTAPKLRWVRQHEPAIFQQVAKVLLPKDYLRWLLTGDFVSDMSDASGTLWLDVQRRAWCEQLLALSGLTLAQMPRLVEGSQVSGTVRPEVAQLLGLPANVIVAGGAGDNAASAIGIGVTQAGQGFLSLGTSGVLFVATPSYQPNAASATHAFCHALPQQWHQMSVMLSAASALTWVSRLLQCQSEAELANQASRLSFAERAAAPLFLPYLAGERTPHNDAAVRASFHGLGFESDAASLGYAVMEGVSFGLADGLAALRAAGSAPARLSLVGGGSKSAMWAQQLASILKLEIVTHASSALGGALGGARLAWLASGGAASDVCPAPTISASYWPDPAEQELLSPRYARFKALYRR